MHIYKDVLLNLHFHLSVSICRVMITNTRKFATSSPNAKAMPQQVVSIQNGEAAVNVKYTCKDIFTLAIWENAKLRMKKESLLQVAHNQSCLLEAIESLTVIFHSLKEVLSLLRICDNDVCKISYHLESPLSNVIYYFYISNIIQGLAVVIAPGHATTGCRNQSNSMPKVSSTLWTGQIS